MFRRRALRRRLESAGAVPSALDDGALRALRRAADAGAGGGECVRAATCVRLAALRLWRWPQLSDAAELRRLPACADTGCCNPWHWSRLCKPETPPPPPPPPAPAPASAPPPPYSRVALAMHDAKAEDHEEISEDARRTDHERPPCAGAAAGSLTTDGEERMWWEREWCRLAYWELTRRVGRQYGVRPRAVDVFGGGDAAAGPRSGLCLEALRSPPPPGAPPEPPPEQVRRARAKIGLGVTLSLEADGVWLYNRSDEPVFVSSPALDAAAARALLVWRVAPGHCLCVFDPRAPPAPPPARAPFGPVDPRSVRISFAKGWGPKYSRRDVTACPCWLEVLLAPPPPPPPHS